MVFSPPSPTVEGNNITVNRFLRQPLEVSRDLADLTLEQFFAEDLFTPGPDAPSGAVIYDELSRNDLYPDRDPARHTPGGQFPLIITSRPEPKTRYAEEYGGKFYLTYDAVKRNRLNELTRNERLLANSLVLKWNGIATSVLDAAVTAVGASAIVPGDDWSLDETNILKNLAAAQLAADQRKMGIVLDTALVNPIEWFALVSNEKVQKLLTDATREAIARNLPLDRFQLAGFTIRKSHQQTEGQSLVVAAGQVGGRHRDAPASDAGENIAYDADSGIATQTWDDPQNTRHWVQSWKSEILYVDNPFAVYRLEGIG